MRLAKYLAHAGVASRRAAEAIVAAGRVTVDGEIVRDPALNVEEDSEVAVDHRSIAGPEPRVVYAVNKPLGVLSTASDPHGRPTVVSLVPARGLRLYPVGRLDADSGGLILLTNDGDLAHRLTHPSFEVSKTYRVTVAGAPVGQAALAALRDGVELDDGPTAPAEVRRIGSDALEITIHEGRNRQVRRMCEAVGHPVVSLRRIAFGPLRLGELAPGAHRTLSPPEIDRLRDCSRARTTPGGDPDRDSGGGPAGDPGGDSAGAL
jgi:23S rRNA pseudouridine2605 synthase